MTLKNAEFSRKSSAFMCLFLPYSLSGFNSFWLLDIDA